MADYTPSRDEPATRDPVNPNNNNPVEDYEQITNFHYMSNGQVVTGGSANVYDCLLYTSPSPRDRTRSRMPSSA